MACNNSTTPLATARRVRALELRLQGRTYREIGAVLGCNPATAYRATQKALRLTLAEPAEELRTLELVRLDRLQEAL